MRCSDHRKGDVEVEAEGIILSDGRTVTVRGGVTAVVPARLSGPPERCCPQEGGETEIFEVVDEDSGLELLLGELSDEDLDRLDRALFSRAEESWESMADDEEYGGPYNGGCEPHDVRRDEAMERPAHERWEADDE